MYLGASKTVKTNAGSSKTRAKLKLDDASARLQRLSDSDSGGDSIYNVYANGSNVKESNQKT